MAPVRSGEFISEADVDSEVWAALDAGTLQLMTRGEESAQFLVGLRHLAERVQLPLD